MRNAIFIFKGKLRKLILRLLSNKPKNAKLLSKEAEKHITSVSRTLIELESNKFVECVNPEDDRFRFYKITRKGKNALKKIAEIEK